MIRALQLLLVLTAALACAGCTALSIEAASRQLPDAKRLAFTADVQTLFQQYASGQR
jgi:hypothetical protein